MSTTKPQSYVVLPDNLTRTDLSTAVVTQGTVTSEQTGPYVGPAAPQLSNRGELVPFTRGRWSEDAGTEMPNPEEIYLRLVNAGSLYTHAEWAWKFETDSDDQWRGQHDLRYHYGSHDPFAGGNAAPTESQLMVLYSKAFNRLLCFRYMQSVGVNGYEIAYRDASIDDPTASYSYKDFPRPNGFLTHPATGPSDYPYRNPSATYCPNGTVGWENQDGTLRVLYAYTAPRNRDGINNSKLTMDLYGSSDGGLTWELIAEDLATKYLGGDRQIKHMSADCSGDWIRVCMWVRDVSPEGVITMVSADKGATWKVVGTGLPDDLDELLYEGTNKTKYQTFAVAGTGTPDGRFVRIRYTESPPYSGGLTRVIRFETCTRDGDWSMIEKTNLANFLPYFNVVDPDEQTIALGICRTDNYLHTLVVNQDIISSGTFSGKKVQGFTGLYSMKIPLNGIEDATQAAGSSTGWDTQGSWINLGHQTSDGAGLRTSARYWSGFQNMDMTAKSRIFYGNAMRWIGDRLFVLSNIMNRTAATDTIEYKDVATYAGGWSRRPIRSPFDQAVLYTRDENGTWLNDPDSGQFESHYWSPCWGKPQTMTTPGTDPDCPDDPWWTLTHAASGPTEAWDGLEYTLDTSAATNLYAYLRKTFSHSGLYTAGNMGNIGLLAWTMKVYNTDDLLTLPSNGLEKRYPAVGVSIEATNDQPPAGGTMWVSVAATTSEVAVYDAGSGATLYHKAGLDLTKWHEFRLAWAQGIYASELANGSYADFGVCRLGSSNKWNNSGMLTVSATTSSNSNRVLLGIGVGAPASGGMQGDGAKIGLKETLLSIGTTNMGQENMNFRNPVTLRGAMCGSGERHIAQGVFASWGGGGGFLEDQYHVPIRYQYGADQFSMHSPESHWRSKTESAVTLTFDAQKEGSGNEHQYFHHEAVALVGCNVPEVRVDWADNSGFSSGLVGVTVDFTMYDLFVAGTVNDGIQVTNADVGKFEPHELGGMFLQIDGDPAGTTHTFKIRDNDANTITVTGLTQAFSSYPLNANATAKVFSSQSGKLLMDDNLNADGKRYMRLTFPAYNSSDGFHKLGGIIAGSTISMTVPLDWTYTDQQTPNVRLNNNINGTRTAYVGGKPRRNFQGTLLGDASRFRTQFRRAIDELADYSGRPVVLVTDDQDFTGSMLYSRFTSSTDMQNSAWKYDAANSRWIKVGDMAVTFEEEL